MLFLTFIGETGLSHDIFSKFSLWPFEVVEVEQRLMLNFEAATSKFCNCSSKFGSSPRKGKTDVCMTNGSKVLIYLTLLYFLLHYLQVYSKKWDWCIFVLIVHIYCIYDVHSSNIRNPVENKVSTKNSSSNTKCLFYQDDF